MEDLAKEIRLMQEQRETHHAEAARFDVEARSQISQIRETIAGVLNADQPLITRMRNLLREQGITVASILTALGFIICTLVLALIGRKPSRPASQTSVATDASKPPENKPTSQEPAAAAAAAAAATGGGQQAPYPTPATRYEEPEPAAGGVCGAINWLHIQLERFSAWLGRVVDKLSSSKCPLAPPLAWLLKHVKRLTVWLAENTYSHPIKAE
jgi:hypothetical protein